jgi:hypothetical protein
MQSYRRWLWFRSKRVTPTEFFGSRQFAKQWCDQNLPGPKSRRPRPASQGHEATVGGVDPTDGR